MGSTSRWIVVAVGAVVLALGACSATGPTQARGEPALRFASPADADNGSEGCDEHGDPARVRRDAYGRPIYFREIPLDRHGVARAEPGAPRSNQGRCTEKDDSATRRGSDDR